MDQMQKGLFISSSLSLHRNRHTQPWSQWKVCSWLHPVHARGPYVCVQLSRDRCNSGRRAPQPSTGVHAPERGPSPGRAHGSHHWHFREHRQHLARRRGGSLHGPGLTWRNECIQWLVLGPLPSPLYNVQRGPVLRPGWNRQWAQPERHRGFGKQGSPDLAHHDLPSVYVETLVVALRFRLEAARIHIFVDVF